jgi:hypothetical protein
VSDGGPGVAAYETPAVAASRAMTATIIAGRGRRESSERGDMELLAWVVGRVGLRVP